MIKLAITMTATRRIGLIRETLCSFQRNLLLHQSDMSLCYFINVDPVGPDTQSDVRDFFTHVACPGQVIYAQQPGFGAAFYRVWESATRWQPDFVLHLEDDWRLNRPVGLYYLLSLFTTYPGLAILRLSAFPSHGTYIKTWNKFTYWNGDFYQIPDQDRGLLGFAGHPSIIRPDFVKLALETLDPTRNPEKQLKGRNKVLRAYFDTHMFGVYNHWYGNPLVTDLGRKWMLENGYRKAGCKANFTQWETIR